MGAGLDPQTREYIRFLAATPANLSEDQLFAKERALIADVSEELRQGRRCQIYATYTGEKDVTLRLETILRQAGFRVVVLRSSVPRRNARTGTSGSCRRELRSLSAIRSW